MTLLKTIMNFAKSASLRPFLTSEAARQLFQKVCLVTDKSQTVTYAKVYERVKQIFIVIFKF